MCLAIFKPKNNPIPSEDTLFKAWSINPHGAGISILHDGHVQIIKGLMTIDDLLDTLKSLDQNKEMTVHLRWATSGTIDQAMTHPFSIDNTSNKIKSFNYSCEKSLVHNGVLFSPNFQNFVSDTCIFTRYLHLIKNDFKTIEKLIGHNKIAIMDSTTQKTYLFGFWEQFDDGNFYSNDNFLFFEKSYSFKDSFSKYDDEYLCECPLCESEEIEYIGVRTKTYECLKCGTVFNESEFLEYKIDTDKDLFLDDDYGYFLKRG